jgi:two-component system sensor histidine kinase/response regulator
MHAGAPVFDRDVALERSGGDAELLRELAVLFLTEYPSQLASLASAVERADTGEVDRAAHMHERILASPGLG